MARQQGATSSYKRERGLTVEQQNAIDLLVTGKSDQDTADAVGVNRVTVSKWRLYDPWFQAELNRRRQDLWGTAAERLRGMLPKALDVLEGQLDDPDRRLTAAVQVVKLAGLEKLGRPNGETDGDVLLDDMARARRPDPLRDLVGRGPVTDHERRAVLENLERRLADD